MAYKKQGNVIKASHKHDLFNIAVHIVEKYWNILTRPLYLVSREILQNLKYRKVEPVEDYDLSFRAMLDSNVKRRLEKIMRIELLNSRE